MRNQLEEHHMIPVSCSGPNWKENCINIRYGDHKTIHETLDVPYGLLRRFRKRTNHLLYMDVYYVDELAKLQRLYFARLPELPRPLQNRHFIAMRNVFTRACKEYEHNPAFELPQGTVPEQFYMYLNFYHEVLYHKARVMESVLKPK